MVTQLRSDLAAADALVAVMLGTLTDTQTRCTELISELRAYRQSGLCLPGWWCPCALTDKSLGIFNGGSKEWRTHCRACGAPRSK